MKAIIEECFSFLRFYLLFCHREHKQGKAEREGNIDCEKGKRLVNLRKHLGLKNRLLGVSAKN